MQLYRNTVIMVYIQCSPSPPEAQLLKLMDELESNAMDVVDMAIERAKGQSRPT